MIERGVGGGQVSWERGRIAGGRGIVVVFWWVSGQEKLVDSLLDLHSSLGWTSLICRADFFCACNSERSSALAFLLLSELLKELMNRPRPVVFTALSGGPKACTYKAYQIIQGKDGVSFSPDEVILLRRCFCGHIYHYGPLDLSSDLVAYLALHPMLPIMPGPIKFVSWLERGLDFILRGLYITCSSYQDSEYWQTLTSSVELEAPYLVFSSDDASYKRIRRFIQDLRDLGGDVNLMTFQDHEAYDPTQNRTAVTSLLDKAVSLYPHRVQHIGEIMHDEISDMIWDLQEVAVNSNQSLRRVASGPGDHFFVSASVGTNSQLSQNDNKEVHPVTYHPPGINVNSVLGHILFDACVPKNVEGWDIRFSSCLNGQPVGSAHRHSRLRGLKGILRSRL